MHVDRLLVIALISTLAACGSDSQPGADLASQPVAEPVEEPAVEPVAEQPAPKPDRFANMYVDEITQSYDPGLKIGETFPSIRAWYQGKEIRSIEQFVPDRGAIFIAVRSVNW